jgi:hypothetical protein
MKKTIWIEPCKCDSAVVKKAGKEVARLAHNKLAVEGKVTYSPLQGQVEGFDADGAPIPAEYSI